MQNPFSLQTPEAVEAVIASARSAIDRDMAEGRKDRIPYLHKLLARATEREFAHSQARQDVKKWEWQK